MAIIKYGSIVTGGSGSLGGSTLQPCHSGNIWRNKPQQTYSRTPAQAQIRSYNKTMQAGWRALTDQDRLTWNNFAKVKPVFNRSGEKHAISGHSLWMKYQYEYISRGAPFLSDPAIMGPPYLGPELIINPNLDNPAGWIIWAGSSITDRMYVPNLASGYNYIAIATGTPDQLRFEVVCDAVSLFQFVVYYHNYNKLTISAPGKYIFTSNFGVLNSFMFVQWYAQADFILSRLSVKGIYN